MTVVRTDLWLESDGDNPIQLCQRLTPYFPETDAAEISEHLQHYGMYKQTEKADSHFPRLKFAVWRTIQREEKQLKKIWGDVDIPIFILPSDYSNRTLQRYFNSKSGLAFKDKLFLFVSEHNTQDEIRALFIHEYNHVCRLHLHLKQEDKFTLLDSVIMEGLAEYAVYNRIGQSYIAKWTHYYSNPALGKIWRRFILPNRSLSRHHPKHDAILYGTDSYPSMAGYATGYFAVQSFMKETDFTWSKCLKTSSEIIAQLESGQDV